MKRGVWGTGGGGARFDPKPSQVGDKDEQEEKKYKNMLVAGFEPTTLRLQILHLTR